MNENGRELGWDEEVKNDSTYTLLEEGDYNFVVKSFERGRHAGSLKIPPCNKAIVTFEVSSDQQAAEIKREFLLYSTLAWLIHTFFVSIGLAKHGEPASMTKWPATIGRHGRCHVIVDTFIKKDGTEGKSNKINNFLEPDEQTSFAQAAPTTPQAGGWQSGRF